MILGAIVIAGSKAAGPDFTSGSNSGVAGLASDAVACTEVLGRSILHRVIGNLTQTGVNSVSVICHSRLATRLGIPAEWPVDITSFRNSSESDALIEQKRASHIDRGAGKTLLIDLDAYLEFEFADVLEFHRDRGQIVTRLRDEDGPLNFWIIDEIRARQAGFSSAALLRGAVSRSQYRLRGYCNRLRTPQDMRRFVADAFYSRCRVRPSGTEIKPGVWVDERASVDRSARLVAPVYIGRNSRVQAGALVTRCSNIEHNCTVGCGTVVEDASILADTYLGQGLDVSHAVVEGSRFVHLRRNVAVSIADPTLIASTLLPVAPDSLWVDPIAVPVAAQAGDELYGASAQVA